jgi:Putative prokaryotic signal transducing protein
MKKVYTGKDPLMTGHLKNVLATFGIACVTKNLELSSAAGELPPIECWPELWIVDDQRQAEAGAILRKTLAPLESVKKPWRCRGCAEEVEGQFSECWNCGESRDRGLVSLTSVTRLPSALRNR